ncbi:DUF5110 domain-containing protein [Streptococcus suis]|nr:DUF5110 domain-containing protein [Streptococcus suis]
MKKSSKYLFDKRYCYSIRRLAVGVASVVIGCSVFGGHLVLAETVGNGEVMNEGVASESSGPQPVSEEESFFLAENENAVDEELSFAPASTTEMGTETKQQQEMDSVELAADRVEVSPHETVYQQGEAVANNLKDRLPYTLAELRYDLTDERVTLPQTIDFQFDQALSLDRMEIHKRTPGNGTLTKYKVQAFAGGVSVYESDEMAVDYSLTTISHIFDLDQDVDKVSLTLLEARTGESSIQNRMLTLRDVVFYEFSKSLTGKKIDNSRLTITGSSEKYHTSNHLAHLVDGNMDTLAEFDYTETVKLPEDIHVRLDRPTEVSGYALHKRFASNGSLTRYQVLTYLGDELVEETDLISVPFATTVSTKSLSGQLIDRLVFRILEAKRNDQAVAPHQLTLREVELFEKITVEEPKAEETIKPEQPETSPGTTPPSEPKPKATNLPPVESNEGYVKPAAAIGAITSFTLENGVATIQYATGQQGQLRLYNDHVFRYYVNPDGDFLENPLPSREDRPAVIVNKAFNQYKEQYNETGRLISEDSRYIIETEKVWLIFDKETARLSIYDREGNRYVTKELVPVQLGRGASSQTLSQDENEFFFGGGMQNGRFSHKGQKINIVNENNWVDGGVTSPSPFYWSTNGYGVLRNTFQRGFYDFGTETREQISTTHTENRFDAYFFINSSPTAIIKDYQELTGAPVVLPEYALYLGHLNAYNRDYWVEVAEGTRGAIKLGDKWYREYQPQHLPEADRPNAVKETLNGEGTSYPFSAKAVIDRYEEQNMPLAWFLPNDGYGAGYGQTDSLDGNIANLKKFVDYAKSKGIQVGLWTQSDLVDTNPSKEVVLHRDIDKEVTEAGIRAIKTDVAWVGPGYSFGLNGIDEGAKRITQGSGAEQARPFIVTLDGWGGTQRSAAIWSGDQSGGEWEYIRFHIPTYIGLGLSGNPNIGSDMDGIFGGADPIINARDYQWKIFTSILMNMDGWGAKPKTPFSFDDRTTDINRISLKQKSTLMPYAYSLGHEARETGKPIVRAMFIEFPDEVINYGKDVQYQYMYGANLLVAPVYKNTAMQANGDDIRNNIYLPGGEDQEWIDWYTGQKYKGGQVLNGFAAPLWKAPVFVRNGAIIPMTAANNNPGEIDRTKRVIQFYPHGDTSFTLYEDDGKSIGYQAGQLAKTVISSQAGDSNEKGRAVLTIGATEGSFPGFIKEKTTELHVNVSEDVDAVTVRVGNQDVTLRRVNSLEEYEAGSDVFYYHANPLMATYNPKSADIQNLRVEMNDLLKIKLAARDVTQAAVVVTVDGFVHQNPVAEVPADAQVPTIPTGLAAPEEGISATSIHLQWTGVDGASSYDILRDGTLFTGITGTNFTFEDFAYGSEHSFKIRAVNAKGASAWSQELRVATNEDPWSDAIEGIQATTNITPQSGQGLDKLFDKQVGHQFHSQWGEAVSFPATINMDLGGTYEVDRIEYYPRNDNGANGRITKAYFEVSEDGVNWTTDEYYSVWANDNKTKTYKFAVPRVRYIRMHIAEGVNSFVSGEELLVFKKPGSRMLIPGDISNDGRISDDDKTSFLNYTGLRTEDNDFGYISHADSNKNGLIDAYDISVAAVQLEGGVATPSQSNPAGRTYLTADKLNLTAGQTTTIRLMAADLEAVNALTSTVMIDGSQFEVVGQVTANQTFTKEAENFSYVRTRGNQSNIVFSFVNFGDKPQLTGSGEIGRITLKALKDGPLNLTMQDGILVSNGLRTKEISDSAIRQAVNFTAVPTVPGSVQANRITSGSATLTWTGDKQAFEYLIEQETADGFVSVGQTDQTSFTVYNLAPESNYHFRVKAKNSLGTSAASEVVSLVTPAKDATRKVPIVLATASIAEQEGTGLTNFIDGNDTTLYHSSWANRQAVPSHLVLDLGQEKDVDHILYRPRNNAGNGTITSVKLSISIDGEEWTEVTAPIAWAINNTEKVALLPEGSKARYIKVDWLASVGGFVSGKEIAVYGPAASPIQPEVPVQPEQPTEPEVPVQPEQPTEPEVPVQPEQPTEPEVPVQPEQPAEPEVPVQPEQPAEPESPAQPEQPIEELVTAVPDTAPTAEALPLGHISINGDGLLMPEKPLGHLTLHGSGLWTAEKTLGSLLDKGEKEPIATASKTLAKSEGQALPKTGQADSAASTLASLGFLGLTGLCLAKKRKEQ